MLHLDPVHRRRLARLAERAYPRESCAVLVGRRVAGGTRVEGVRPAANLAPGEGCFDLDPGTLVAAERDARARGLEIVGIWHSHADAAARLSRADLAVAYDGWLHAVTAVERGSVRELRAFRVDDGRPCEEALAP